MDRDIVTGVVESKLPIRQRGRKINNMENTLIPYILSFPGAFLVFLFAVLPFGLNIIISFTDYSLVKRGIAFNGLTNYVDIFTSGVLGDVITRTFIFTIGCIVPSVILGIAASLVMNSNTKGVNILKAAILLPWILPESVTGYTWQWMFSSDFGIIPYYLRSLGIIDENVTFLSSGRGAMFVVILANTWRAFPFIAIMLYAKLKTIPGELVEAAKIDGANDFHVFIHVTLSWISEILSRSILLTFIWTFNAFAIIYTITNGGPAGETETLPLVLQRFAFTNYTLGKAASLGVIAMIIIICIILLSKILKFINKKVMGVSYE